MTISGPSAEAGSPERSLSILVISDSPFSRIGVVSAFAGAEGFAPPRHSATDPGAVDRAAAECRPDVVVILDDADPEPVLAALADGGHGAPRVLLLRLGGAGAHDDVPPGVHGILAGLTDPAMLVSAVRLAGSGYQVAGGRPGSGDRPLTGVGDPALRAQLARLTWREIEVVSLLLRGWSNQEIAEALALSASTVKSHIRSLLGKLELHSRIDVITRAYAVGLVRPGVAWHPHRAGVPS
ncbi:response regulator transcription factor [Kitasatospora sp. NPDC094019]|uniref:helix-turn-helix transcriptional regulator n=1 Tax=Kitasatospora sp. NPDC094019 TaxID=3364091 RepID=UPI0037F10A3D